MSGVLFLIEVCVFVLIAYWAYANDRVDKTAGIFAMKDGLTSDVTWAERRRLRWKSHATFTRMPTRLHRNGPTWSKVPRWKRRERR